MLVHLGGCRGFHGVVLTWDTKSAATLAPGLEVSEACGGSLWLWDVHGGGAAGQTCGCSAAVRSCCEELPAFSLCFSLRGSSPDFFFSSSFSPERTEVILSGWQ